MSIVTAELTLGAAVASPAGTFTAAYPSGYAQANFTGINASATAYMIVNGNDRYEEADDEFDISYGASDVTVTNKTGGTLAAGTSILLGLARLVTVEELVALTDSSGGNASNTIVDVPAAYTEATLANQLASLTAKVNQIITAIKDRL
ncbi:hypothetical protein [Aminobacter sp. BE322]|uniref:hypothetical protein n=1 Tax=unclassified Aminobacter TaxID=2644704 RepID=UPI003D238038